MESTRQGSGSRKEGPTWGSGWSRSGSVQLQKLRSDPLPPAWVVLLDAVDAQVNGPCLLSSVMKPDPMDQREAYVYIKAAGHSCSPKIKKYPIRTCRRRWVYFLIESSLWIAAGVDTLPPSARAATQGPTVSVGSADTVPKKVGKWRSRRLKDSNVIRLAADAAAAANHMSDHLNFRFWG